MNATGKCLCGAVTFVANGVTPELHICHCSMCRKWGGGPLMSVGAEGVAFRGEENVQRYESSAWAERGFCKRCGSSLFYRLKEGDSYFLGMGTLDDQSPFKLTSEIYVDEKPPGYDFVGSHPRLTAEEFLASLTKK